MTAHADLEKVRWALAERLEGMQEPCPRNKDGHGSFQGLRGRNEPFRVCPDCGLQGYGKKARPVPLTAEGLIDDVRLLRVLKSEHYKALYDVCEENGSDHTGKECWVVSASKHSAWEHHQELAIAYLRAVDVGC